MGYAELIKNPVAPIPSGIIDLTVTVEEPPGVLDYINSALNTWGAPVKEFFAIVTTIGGAGISGWIINKVRKNRKEKDEALVLRRLKKKIPVRPFKYVPHLIDRKVDAECD